MSGSGVNVVRTTAWSAGPGCHGGCGVLAYVKDNMVIKVEGDPDHPWAQGRLCARALAITQYMYHPDRLKQPLKRVGQRGEGQWEEITWDEAFDIIEAKMKKIREEHGSESFIFSMGTGRDIPPWICMLAYAYGSPNVMFSLSGIACYSPRIAAVETVQGDYAVFDAGQWLPERYDSPRYEAPECIMIFGYNIPATCPDNLFGHWIVDLMKRGTKIIAIDPRLSWFASRAKKWLPIRPGTDGALAMGLLKVIVDEGLYDGEFLERWTNAPHLTRVDTGRLLRESDLKEGGSPDNFIVWDAVNKTHSVWDTKLVQYVKEDTKPTLSGEFKLELRDGSSVRVKTVWDAFCDGLADYPLEKVSEITMIPAEDIRDAALLYARSKPAAIHWGVPIDMTPAVTPTVQAITLLWCLTGNLDIPGGNVISRYAFDAVAYALPGTEGVIKLKSAEHDKKRIGADRYGPLKKFIWRAQTDLVLDQMFSGDPYPIKGMWIQGCNIVGGIGLDPKRWVEAMKKLDFVVAVDLFHTPTTQIADVVLPATSFLEKDGVRSWWVPLQIINKTVTVDGCRPDVEINFELAKRFDPNFSWDTIHDLFDEILKPSGMTFDELKEKGGWAIPPEGTSSSPYHRHEKGLLRRDGRQGFNTPSGLVEIYSVLREDWRLEPLPHYEEPPLTPVSRPDLAEEYPLILSTGRRSPVYFHSEHRNIPWLRKIHPHPLIEIHPSTAERYGISHGEWVWVENWMGGCMLKAKVTPIVPEWMVMAEHGWWFPEEEGAEPSLYGVWKSNINQLIPMGYQGEDGLGAPIKHLMCRIRRATTEEELDG
jgi:anaerobic selenocysteine-containing dehydrogenase